MREVSEESSGAYLMPMNRAGMCRFVQGTKPSCESDSTHEQNQRWAATGLWGTRQ